MDGIVYFDASSSTYWHAVVAGSGHQYYVNSSTGESSWTLPEGAARYDHDWSAAAQGQSDDPATDRAGAGASRGLVAHLGAARRRASRGLTTRRITRAPGGDGPEPGRRGRGDSGIPGLVVDFSGGSARPACPGPRPSPSARRLPRRSTAATTRGLRVRREARAPASEPRTACGAGAAAGSEGAPGGAGPMYGVGVRWCARPCWTTCPGAPQVGPRSPGRWSGPGHRGPSLPCCARATCVRHATRPRRQWRWRRCRGSRVP